MSARADVAVLISMSGDGGVERMVMNLVAEFAARGLAVDLLTIRARGGHLRALPATVRHRPLKAKHTSTSMGEIASYLRDSPPRALLAAKDRAGRAAVRARRRAGATLPLWIRLGTNLAASLAHRDPVSRWLRTAPMRRIYARANGVIAVSQGVADDTRRITGLPAERVQVVRNPVITAALQERAADPVPHPWLADKPVPVVLGVGRLTRQKDFPTLFEAFARLRRSQAARLVVLGEGADRAALERLAHSLGIAEDILLPGFQANPYAWLSRADLFVLSSAWEGSPNALTEALALGVPSVSTDCPSGPSELLQAGRVAPLVAVGDANALATAMQATLATPPPADTLRDAVREYRAPLSAQRYLECLGLA